MTNEEIRRLEMFRHGRNFGASRDAVFPAGSLARDLFNIVSGVVEELEGHSATQSSGRSAARQSTTGKAVIRADLHEILAIFRRTARAMALVTPGLEEKFRIPRKMNDQKLLETARAFLRDATPLKAEFLRHEVPERVFQELEANIAAFDAALNGQYEGNEASVSAVAAIDDAIERGMIAVRRLDAIVRNRLGHDAASLAAWESARHIERASGAADPEETEEPEASGAPKVPKS